MRFFAFLTLLIGLASAAMADSHTSNSDYSADAPIAQVTVDLVSLDDLETSLPARWSVLAYMPNHEGRHAIYASTAAAKPNFSLPPGRYLILAERDDRRERLYVDVLDDRQQELKLIWRP